MLARAGANLQPSRLQMSGTDLPVNLAVNIGAGRRNPASDYSYLYYFAAKGRIINTSQYTTMMTLARGKNHGKR